MCLPDSKGRTKGFRPSNEKFSLPTDLLEIGQEFYKNHMKRLFEIIYPNGSQVGFRIYLFFIL